MCCAKAVGCDTCALRREQQAASVLASNSAVQERVVERIAEEAAKDKDATQDAQRRARELVMSRDDLQRRIGQLHEQREQQEAETKALQRELDKVCVCVTTNGAQTCA